MWLVAAGLLISGIACEDRCDEERHELDVDEVGPFGASSRETFGFIEGTRTGTLWWLGSDQVAVEVTTTLDDHALDLARWHVGKGRLYCPDALATWARVHIATPEAVYFDDTIEVWLEVWTGDPTELVEVSRDVTDHEFEGLLVQPPSAVQQLGLTLRLAWRDDAAGSMQGWLVLGDDEIARFDAVLP